MSDAHYTVFDANTFGPDEVPVYEYLVLIDVRGKRKQEDYLLGYYNHLTKSWVSDTHSITFQGTWSFLPLSIYDNNPELRKTVKI